MHQIPAQVRLVGRKKTTGRFATREELEEKIWFLWHCTACGINTIARDCEIAPLTVSKILEEKNCPPDIKLLQSYSGVIARRTL